MKYPTKGPGDLPPYEPDDSIWDDHGHIAGEVAALRSEWVDEAEELLLDYMYGALQQNPELHRRLTLLTNKLTEKIEQRAEAARYPPD
jgi:hypothetical protein